MMKDGYLVYRNVSLGKGFKIEPFCIIGEPPRGKKAGELPLVIGQGAIIRSFSKIYAGSKIGDYLQTGAMAFIREDNLIGDNVVIGTGSVLEFGNRIGNNVRIHSSCFMEMAQIGDGVFIGPGVIMTDDLHPPCRRFKDCVGGVRIDRGARIGAGVTLLPGVKIGKGALIGAGSVVTRAIPDNMVAVGNPAKVIKSVSKLECIKGFFEKPYLCRKDKISLIKKRGLRA